jgi:hypothetical protein
MLGKGSFGVVMKAEWNVRRFGLFTSKKDVAAKIIATKNENIVIHEVGKWKHYL